MFGLCFLFLFSSSFSSACKAGAAMHDKTLMPLDETGHCDTVLSVAQQWVLFVVFDFSGAKAGGGV